MDSKMYMSTDTTPGIHMGQELKFTTAEKKNIDDNTKARHTHDNKKILDSITQENIDNWNKNHINIDEEMSDTSTNAVQNKAVKKYIDNNLGDVGTALDNIIAIQNELIGGDNI